MVSSYIAVRVTRSSLEESTFTELETEEKWEVICYHTVSVSFQYSKDAGGHDRQTLQCDLGSTDDGKIFPKAPFAGYRKDDARQISLSLNVQASFHKCA